MRTWARRCAALMCASSKRRICCPRAVGICVFLLRTSQAGPRLCLPPAGGLRSFKENEAQVGILAVPGDFAAHAAMLAGMGIEAVEVRSREDLAGCDGLILPGGESTTQLQFLQEEGLYDAIKKFAADDKAIFGTCAGAILLATEV